jgi:hypothetical protein
MPLGFGPIELFAICLAARPGPAILPGERDGGDRLAARGGAAADGHEEELLVLPRRDRVVAVAQILDQGVVALVVLLQRGDHQASEIRVHLRGRPLRAAISCNMAPTVVFFHTFTRRWRPGR